MASMHPSNVLITQDGLAIVDWFDASLGEPVVDVARCLLVLLGDGEHPPAHLPGADPVTLGRLAAAYRARAIEVGAITRNCSPVGRPSAPWPASRKGSRASH